MFRRRRLRKIHARFLQSCRNLKEGRSFWDQSVGFRRWILESLSPVPLLSLQEDGRRFLQALEWLEANCRVSPLRETTLRQCHRILLGETASGAGSYRTGDMNVVGSRIPRPSAQKLPALMKQLDLKLEEEQKRLDEISRPSGEEVLLLAMAIHQRIVFIHPFPDANGRVARLAMSWLLRRYDQGYVILPPVNESQVHFDALEEAHRGNMEPLVKLARSCSHAV